MGHHHRPVALAGGASHSWCANPTFLTRPQKRDHNCAPWLRHPYGFHFCELLRGNQLGCWKKWRSASTEASRTRGAPPGPSDCTESTDRPKLKKPLVPLEFEGTRNGRWQRTGPEHWTRSVGCPRPRVPTTTTAAGWGNGGTSAASLCVREGVPLPSSPVEQK